MTETNDKLISLRSGLLWAGLAVGVFCGSIAEARPEYAVRFRTTSCTACHVSPFGGGLRTLDGKLFGSRQEKPSQWALQEYLSADLRGIAYYPKGGTQSRQGTGIMTTTIGAHVPVSVKENGSELRAVGAFSIGVINQGPREIYAQWRSAAKNERPWIAQFGRFNAPFGIMTDEHRTYTRLLTRTEIFDYEAGASLSKLLFESLHVDVALTNGLQSGGQFNQGSPTSPDSTAGAFANLRWTPVRLPFFIGASFGYHQRLPQYQNPYAVSLYSLFSFDRMTHDTVKGSLALEGVYAESWADADLNPMISRYFVPSSDTAYTTAIKGRPSLAWNAMFNLDIARDWTLQYKLDALQFDPDYAGDRFLRHGLGAKYYVDANVSVWARYEIADVGRPEFKDANIFAAQDAFWAMFQLWL